MKNLYVGNLPHSTTETELRTLFQPHGYIERVSLVTDRDTGRSKGFAFVEMADAGEADKAITALKGTEFGGRTLTINEAKPKAEQPRAVVMVSDALVAVGAGVTIIAAMLEGRGSHAGNFGLHRFALFASAS